MITITNTSSVTDYSGETPIITYSNPVTTVIRQFPPATIITRIYCCQLCGDCNCRNCCDCGCNSCCNSWSNSWCGCNDF